MGDDPELACLGFDRVLIRIRGLVRLLDGGSSMDIFSYFVVLILSLMAAQLNSLLQLLGIL